MSTAPVIFLFSHFYKLMALNRKLNMGMVGGGRGAFIGAVHRMAANLDGKIQLVAGCFSSDPEKSKLSGQDLFLDPSRVYSSYEEMAAREAALPPGQRIDFVSIVARNDLHYKVAKTFLEAGIHVICEKPLAFSLAEGKELREIVKKSGLVFALTHNYTGYPMVKEARAMVREGKLGRILKVVAEYPQGYAISALKDATDGAISNWRMDPSVSGVSNCIGDIGTHAENLAQYISGLELEEVAAELNTFIPDARSTMMAACCYATKAVRVECCMLRKFRLVMKTISISAFMAPRPPSSGIRSIRMN